MYKEAFINVLQNLVCGERRIGAFKSLDYPPKCSTAPIPSSTQPPDEPQMKSPFVSHWSPWGSSSQDTTEDTQAEPGRTSWSTARTYAMSQALSAGEVT
jgi:hypothetical protein